MEKASTPRNRLTRSSAKQVNTPKSIDQEDTVVKSPGEDGKHNVRKSRRTYNAKAKTNGDTSNIENRINNEDTFEDNVGIKSENDELNVNDKPQDSSEKNTPSKALSPTISRKSLRIRRSLTPGPETESSTSKKIKRSSSSGKLDLLSTPTNRRGRRAKSESKDFVFTPDKDKQSGSIDLNSKYIPNASLRIIERIDEVNEVEKSSEDETDVLTKKGADAGGGIECTGEGETAESLTINVSPLKNTIVPQSEDKALNESRVQETDQPTHSKTEVDTNVALKDPDPHIVTEAFEKPSNPLEVSSENMGKDNNLEKNDANTKCEASQSTKGPCLLVDEITSETVDSENKVEDDELAHKSSALVEENAKEDIINTENKVEDDESAQKPCTLAEEKGKENMNLNIHLEDGESAQAPCVLTFQNETKLSDLTLVTESNDFSELDSPGKDTLKLNSVQDESVVELVSKSDEKICQLSDSDRKSKNQDCEIQECVEVDKIKYDNTAKPDEERAESTDIEVNEEIEVKVSFKPLDSQLKSFNKEEGIDEDENTKAPDCESINFSDNDCKTISGTQRKAESVEISKAWKQLNSDLKSFMNEENIDEEENVEEPDSEPTYSDNDGQRNSETHVEAESIEMCKIEIINSSDSEDDMIQEEIKISTVEGIATKEFHTENENISATSLPIDNEKFLNESSKSHTYIESGPNDFVPVQDAHSIDPNLDTDHNDQILNKDSECYEFENMTHPSNETGTTSDQSRIFDLEGNKLSIKRMDSTCSEQGNSFNIMIENPHSIEIEEPVSENPASDSREINLQDSVLKDQPQYFENEKEIHYGSRNRVVDQVTNQTDTLNSESIEHYGECYNEENYNENFEDEELNKSEDGSCDIYKGLSDSGSYVDEKAEDSQFGESLSSELHSGSGDSEEEYVTSVDGEEENEEEKTEILNKLCTESGDLNNKELILSKDGEKANVKNPDSPMTYDKALAIINQNRVKKIDDEEFFDMFTQELNRVSDQSGSDSDIAIVDEYLMEPEESAKKNQPKSGNVQNSKQPSRPSGPVSTNQPIPHENYGGDFSHPIHAQHGTTINQHGHPIPNQHSHQTLQRVNFTQGALYQPIDQNIHLRGQLMFNQYAHSSSSMQDPHTIFNHPQGVPHTDVNFRRDIFNHPHSLGAISEPSFPPNTSLKMRSLSEMNNVQSFSHKNYFNPPHQAPLDERNFELQEGKDGPTPVAEAHNIEMGGTRPNISEKAVSDKTDDKSRTPILDVLGLDKKSLKLLKKVLGLNSIKRKIMKRDLEWQKKCLEKSILKSELRQRGRKGETRYRNVKRYLESDSSSLKSSLGRSSEESSSCSDFFKGAHYGSSSENDNREVNIEKGSVFVTLKRKSKSRYRNKPKMFGLKRARHSSEESFDTGNKIKKNRFSRKQDSSVVSSKKMTKKQTAVVKSQSGTFTVDPLTASSQSSDSEVQSSDDRNQMRELKRIKQDLVSGKNKLSNMFSQRSSKKPKESKRKTSEPSQEGKGPLRRENLRKLPSEILETLAKEDKKKKRHRAEESGSDNSVERPKKMRKRSQRIKIKSKSGDQNYIPCVTGGATEFGLSRLDKDGTLTLAEKAAKFRSDQLYGAPVKRITSKELMNLKKKQNINNALAKKMSKKRNAE